MKVPTNCIITLGALALGVVVAVPAFAQGTQAGGCIRFQLNCSDASYAVTQPTAARPLYNVVPQVTHHNTQKTGAAETMQKIEQRQRGYSAERLYNYVPPQSAVQPCIHVQTYCL
jgi:hypothetical protein